jgi:hypothetical protein
MEMDRRWAWWLNWIGGEQTKNDPASNVAHNSFPSKDWPNCILPLRATQKNANPTANICFRVKRRKKICSNSSPKHPSSFRAANMEAIAAHICGWCILPQSASTNPFPAQVSFPLVFVVPTGGGGNREQGSGGVGRQTQPPWPLVLSDRPKQDAAARRAGCSNGGLKFLGAAASGYLLGVDPHSLQGRCGHRTCGRW